jgi:Right handed beta helix region
MKWRALLQNQWFQLCLLVAMLSGAAIIYNTVKSTPPSGTASRPSPSSTPPPLPPVRKIRPKKTGQWILDASGARDSDSKDIQVVAASLTDGDLVTVRPGTYTGNCEIAVSARFVGPAPGTGVATIRSVEPKRAGMSITGKKVSLENLSINLDVAGSAAAVRIVGAAQVEMIGCSISTQATYGVFVHENASLTAENSQFRAGDVGSCLVFDGTSHGSLSRCTFSEGRWGLVTKTGAQVEASNCTFEKMRPANGRGDMVAVTGEHASAKLDTCQFTDSTTIVFVDAGGTLTITGSTFQNNGITGDNESTSVGLISVRNKGQAILNHDTFENNKQGVVAMKGGNVTMQDVRMHQTGLASTNQTIRFYSNAVAATDLGSTMIVDDSYIADSPFVGFLVTDGAHLKATKTVVSNSAKAGLQLGDRDAPGAANADLDNVQFIDSPQRAVWVDNGSQLTIQNCRVSRIGQTAITASGQGTRINITKTRINNCGESGLLAFAGGTISVTGGTIEGNKWGAQAGIRNDPAKSGTITLTNCTVQGNTLFGLVACQGATLTMKGGTLEKNGTNTRQDPGAEVRVEP